MKIAYIGHLYFCKKIGQAIEKNGHQVYYYDYNNWGRKLISSLSDIWKVDIKHLTRF